MNRHYVEGSSVADVARRTTDLIVKDGENVNRRVGNWCMMRDEYQTIRELHNVTLKVTNPMARWSERVNDGILTEMLDYSLALNPGFTHHGSWNFYDQWRTVGMELYPYAYGTRIWGENPSDIDQWNEVVKILCRDKTSRHASITIHRPIDRLREFQPCTFQFHWSINKDGKLDMTTMMRSQDALRGLWLDLFSYSVLHEQMCFATNIPIGEYTHFECNVHIYESDFSKVDSSWAKPDDPYQHGIIGCPADFLDIEMKRRVYNCLGTLYKDGDIMGAFAEADGLSPYWRSALRFLIISVYFSKKKVKQATDYSWGYEQAKGCHVADIKWCLQKFLEKKKS